MLHHLASATIQVANLVKYNCNPQGDGNKLKFVDYHETGAYKLLYNYYIYSKTCVKRPIKNRQNKDLNKNW